MELRIETLRCLKERVLNITSGGKVFASSEAQRRWLLGDHDAQPSLVSNPKAALAANVDRPEFGQVPHSGVLITAQEEAEIRQFLGKLLAQGRSLLAPAGLRGAAADGIALDCPTPYDPNCWY